MKDIKDFVNKIIQGDSLDILRTMPSESVDSIITSPPYFNLRDYQIEGQIGLEKTYQEFIQKLVNIFIEVKRVLKKKGTCFVNLGDSYSTNHESGATDAKNGWKSGKLGGKRQREHGRANGGGISTKSLMMIPERFAIAMIDQEWVLRNKIIWIKPNAMPESVQDRWKKAHEYIFFFTKSKKYYFDLDSIRTKHKQVSLDRAEYEQGRNALGLNPSSMGKKYLDNERYMGMPARMVKLNPLGACPPDYFIINTNCSENDGDSEHYATYPQNLIYPFVVAGCPKGGIVLDPFNGSGTTCVVAKKNNRKYIGIDLNPKYNEIAEKRLAGTTSPLF